MRCTASNCCVMPFMPSSFTVQRQKRSVNRDRVRGSTPEPKFAPAPWILSLPSASSTTTGRFRFHPSHRFSDATGREMGQAFTGPGLRHQTPEREAASRRFAGMTSAPRSKPASTKLRYWRVSVPGGKRPEYVGIFEAADEQTAEATAVKQVKLTDAAR